MKTSQSPAVPISSRGSSQGHWPAARRVRFSGLATDPSISPWSTRRSCRDRIERRALPGMAFEHFAVVTDRFDPCAAQASSSPSALPRPLNLAGKRPVRGFHWTTSYQRWLAWCHSPPSGLSCRSSHLRIASHFASSRQKAGASGSKVTISRRITKSLIRP
jgi:hypothetical protein